ncbi:MAG: YdbL family protein [Betaproteobacteria bacterium]|nr:YdbL family protein [Betaproteobacteria bacterium]
MQRIASMIVKKSLLGISRALWLALTLAATPVWADSLENLRASGAIGESYNGYVVAREPGAQEEAEEINAKRRAIYQEKAAAQGIDIDQVAKVYAAEIIRTVPPGTWIQTNGQWKKK